MLQYRGPARVRHYGTTPGVLWQAVNMLDVALWDHVGSSMHVLELT